jgi:hypothetical protein
MMGGYSRSAPALTLFVEQSDRASCPQVTFIEEGLEMKERFDILTVLILAKNNLIDRVNPGLICEVD